MGLLNLDLGDNVPFQVGQWVEEHVLGPARGLLSSMRKQPRGEEAGMREAADGEGE